MQASPSSTRLSFLFAEVLAEAGQGEERFFLVALPGRASPNGRHAAFYHPGLIDGDPSDILHGRDLGVAKAAEIVDRHRIAAFADIDWGDPLQEAALAALLRHEVRHAEQYDELGQAFFDLYDIAELVCQWKVGGLPRGGILYGLIPAEMDANAAAARFLRERWSGAVNDVLNSDYNVLARSNTPPGPLSELPTKMVAFLYMLREVTDDPVRSHGIAFEDRLRRISARAAATWATLVAG